METLGRRSPVGVPGGVTKGFIRAETVAYEDLVTLGSMAEARKHGRLRSEGKTYRVRDGDVLEILFSK
jgi:ribosome-binding ATPase YchF (GTP1/OBG family)